MITRLSHTVIYVLDQDVAYDFYVNKLGFEVRTDAPMGPGARWLTVGPVGQPDLEISLMLPETTCRDKKETAAQMRDLISKGEVGCGVFATTDVHADYKALLEKGVKFRRAPEEEFYGIEAIMEDPFGNWFSLTQHKH